MFRAHGVKMARPGSRGEQRRRAWPAVLTRWLKLISRALELGRRECVTGRNEVIHDGGIGERTCTGSRGGATRTTSWRCVIYAARIRSYAVQCSEGVRTVGVRCSYRPGWGWLTFTRFESTDPNNKESRCEVFSTDISAVATLRMQLQPVFRCSSLSYYSRSW